MAAPKLSLSLDLLICNACGAQYDTTSREPLPACRICDDPRQFVPPSGQSFTTLRELQEHGYRNKIEPCNFDDDVHEVWTEPKFGIGQRACLIKTPSGNVLWDLVAYLDQATVDKLNELGGVKLIVISHPHFYTTWADWSATFHCPVYMSEADSMWANRTEAAVAELRSITSQHCELLPGIHAIVCGGHFDGSMVLHSTHHRSLFVADTILAVPAAHNPDPAKPGVTSYSFMWSIPNAIPLPPDKIWAIWRALRPYEFRATYGVFAGGSNVLEKAGHRTSLKERVLQSAKIAVRAMGYEHHPLLEESL